MGDKIKILILEDNQSDAELLQRELKKSGLIFSSEIVQTREEFENALDSFMPDIILSDYSLPNFDGVAAFHIKQKKHSDIPFIIVSGTIGEENAIELIKNGVTDYALKDKLFSLTPKITRALKDADDIKAKRIADKKIKTEHEKLIQAESQIRSFAKHLNHVLEEERSNLAREIHDELGQQLAGIKIGISSLKKINTKENIAEETINGLLKDIDVTMQSLRKIATELRPGILDSLGLIPSLEWLAKEYEKRAGIACKIETNIMDQKFDKNISTCFFRVCQESLTNVSKHAQATEINIKIFENDNMLLLEISDNGKGIASEKLENPFSMGLLGMRERANIIGAEFQIQSKKDSGTKVQLKTILS